MSDVNKEAIELWIKKLRSGEYAQGSEALRIKDGGGVGKDSYCCLGLACDAYHELTGKGEWQEPKKTEEDVEATKMRFVDEEDEDETQVIHYLPSSVVQFFGFPGYKAHNPSLETENNKSTTAAGLNDMDGASFSEIADAVERTYGS